MKKLTVENSNEVTAGKFCIVMVGKIGLFCWS